MSSFDKEAFDQGTLEASYLIKGFGIILLIDSLIHLSGIRTEIPTNNKGRIFESIVGLGMVMIKGD
jgi:hypothetical protein